MSQNKHFSQAKKGHATKRTVHGLLTLKNASFIKKRFGCSAASRLPQDLHNFDMKFISNDSLTFYWSNWPSTSHKRPEIEISGVNIEKTWNGSLVLPISAINWQKRHLSWNNSSNALEWVSTADWAKLTTVIFLSRIIHNKRYKFSKCWFDWTYSSHPKCVCVCLFVFRSFSFWSKIGSYSASAITPASEQKYRDFRLNIGHVSLDLVI